jgi:hypothetical protein
MLTCSSVAARKPAANNFERDREDVFKVLGSDIGRLTEVTVRLVGAA